MIRMRVDIENREFRAGLQGLVAAAINLKPVMEDFGELMTERTKARFPAGKGPDGKPWAPPTAATLERKRDPRPLYGPSGRLASEIFPQAGDNSVSIGSSLIYAAVQHFGAKKGAFGVSKRGLPLPWGDIPARNIFGIAEEDWIDLFDIVAEHFEMAAKP